MALEWSSLSEQLFGDAKYRLTALLSLQDYVEANELDDNELTEFVEAVPTLLKDNNFKVCQVTLRALHNVVERQPDAFRAYTPAVIPAAIERLGDAKSPVRTEAIGLLMALMHLLGSVTLLEKVASGWSHKSWRVRQGMALLIKNSVSQMDMGSWAGRERDALISNIVNLLEDSNSNVRDAAMECIVNMIQALGDRVRQSLHRFNIRSAQLKEIEARLQAQERSVYEDDDDCASVISVASLASVPEDSVLSPAARALSARNAGNKKRGGYKDSGGVSEGGQLPDVAPVPVESEKFLKGEVDKAISGLSLAVDWEKRIQMMLRLEGLLKGGAPQCENYLEMSMALKESIATQLNDRRSAVSRQACHLVSCLAAALGGRFETLSLYFLPFLFKVVPITVQVMADASESCFHSIIYYCHSPRMVIKICEAISQDKSPKLRLSCTKFLLQILETWDVVDFDRQFDAIETAIKAANADAQLEVRQLGRLLLGAVSLSHPEKIRQMLKGLNNSTGDRWAQAIQQYPGPGSISFPLDEVTFPVAPPKVQARRSSSGSGAHSPKASMSVPKLKINTGTSGSSLPTPRTTSMPLSARPSKSARAADGDSAFSNHSPRSHLMLPPAPKTARPSTAGASTGRSAYDNMPLSARRSTSGRVEQASRVPMSRSGSSTPSHGGAVRLPADDYGAGSASARRNAPVSYSMPSSARVSGASTPAIRARRVSLDLDMSSPAHRAMLTEVGAFDDDDLNLLSESSSFRRVSVIQAVNLVKNAGSDWQKKAEGLMVLGRVVYQEGVAAAAELSAHGDRVIAMLHDSIADAHQKVTVAALEAVVAILKYASQVLQPQMETIMSQVFARMAEPKEVIRKSAAMVLQSFANHVYSDTIISCLTRSLDLVKSWKGRQAILDFCMTHVHAVCNTASAAVLRSWVQRVCSLCMEKSPEMRKVAVPCLQALYANGANTALLSLIASMPAGDQLPLRRGLQSVLPSLEQDLVHFLRKEPRTAREQYHSRSISSDRDSSPENGSSKPAAFSPTAMERPSSALSMASTVSRSREANKTGNENQEPVACHPQPLPARSPAPTGVKTNIAGPVHGTPSPTLLGSAGIIATPRRSPFASVSNYKARTPASGRKGDKASVQEQVIGYLQQLHVAPQVDTIQAICDSVSEGGVDVWRPHFPGVIFDLMSVAQKGDIPQREAAVLAVHEFIDHCSTLFHPILDSLLLQLVECCADSAKEVSQPAYEATHQLLVSMSAASCCDILLTKLPNVENIGRGTAAQNESLVAVVNNLLKCIARLSHDDILQRLEEHILPGLFEAFKHTLPDIRKAVVFCFVEIWKIIGDDLLPKLSPLSTSQKKLVEIYIARAGGHILSADGGADPDRFDSARKVPSLNLTSLVR